MMNSSSCYFLEDILHLILLRLPEKTLVRFKTVSKSWNAQISCPKFIMLHLNQSHDTNNPNMLLCKYGSSPSSRQILLLEFSNQENLVGNIVHRLDHHHPCLGSGFGKDDQPWIVGGPCNGLLYIKQREHDFFTLCNPLTKSFWPLPLSKRNNVASSSRFNINNITSRFKFYGFGYDDVHEDYKLFRAWSSGICRGWEAEIYSLKSNSWTLYQDFSDYVQFQTGYIHLDNIDGVLVNCALHWVVSNQSTYTSYILAFDLRAEKHRFLPIPKVLESCILLELRVLLNGCLLVKSKFELTSSFDMWVMKDYGVKDSWIKITTHMPYQIWSFTPIAHFESKKKLVFYYHREGGRMFLYDLVKDELLETGIIKDYATPT